MSLRAGYAFADRGHSSLNVSVEVTSLGELWEEASRKTYSVMLGYQSF
jgi:hypothetical protein